MSVQRQLQLAVGPQGWIFVAAIFAATVVWIALLYL